MCPWITFNLPASTCWGPGRKKKHHKSVTGRRLLAHAHGEHAAYKFPCGKTARWRSIGGSNRRYSHCPNEMKGKKEYFKSTLILQHHLGSFPEMWLWSLDNRAIIIIQDSLCLRIRCQTSWLKQWKRSWYGNYTILYLMLSDRGKRELI